MAKAQKNAALPAFVLVGAGINPALVEALTAMAGSEVLVVEHDDLMKGFVESDDFKTAVAGSAPVAAIDYDTLASDEKFKAVLDTIKPELSAEDILKILVEDPEGNFAQLLEAVKGAAGPSTRALVGDQATGPMDFKAGILHIQGVAGGYKLGTGEWRGFPQAHGRGMRAPDPYFPKKIDERYTHAHGMATRVLCFGGDHALAKIFEGELRADPKAKLAVGSVISAVQIPQYHFVGDPYYVVDRIGAGFEGLGFKLVAWEVDEKSGEATAVDMQLPAEYGAGSGPVFETTADSKASTLAVGPGKTLFIGLELTAVPAEANLMDILRRADSPEQFRVTVGVPYMQARPQVDEGLGDQFVAGNVGNESWGAFVRNPDLGSDTNYDK